MSVGLADGFFLPRCAPGYRPSAKPVAAKRCAAFNAPPGWALSERLVAVLTAERRRTSPSWVPFTAGVCRPEPRPPPDSNTRRAQAAHTALGRRKERHPPAGNY